MNIGNIGHIGHLKKILRNSKIDTKGLPKDLPRFYQGFDNIIM
jgi:hypothetical protein